MQIDDLLHSVHLDDATNAAWAKVRAEFQQVSDAFHIPSPPEIDEVACNHVSG